MYLIKSLIVIHFTTQRVFKKGSWSVRYEYGRENSDSLVKPHAPNAVHTFFLSFLRPLFNDKLFFKYCLISLCFLYQQNERLTKLITTMDLANIQERQQHAHKIYFFYLIVNSKFSNLRPYTRMAIWLTLKDFSMH